MSQIKNISKEFFGFKTIALVYLFKMVRDYTFFEIL